MYDYFKAIKRLNDAEQTFSEAALHLYTTALEAMYSKNDIVVTMWNKPTLFALLQELFRKMNHHCEVVSWNEDTDEIVICMAHRISYKLSLVDIGNNEQEARCERIV